MHTCKDSYSHRPVAADAWKALRPFRNNGAIAFHNFPVDEVREKYVAACQANGLADPEPYLHDFSVGDFQIRLYDPRDEELWGAPTAVICYIHGGGWLMGNLETHHSACRRLSALTGLPTFAVDYRLAPEHLYPAAVNDCRAALSWIGNSSNEHGIHVSSVSLVGDSAGGQLAAVLANEATAAAADYAPISSQVLIYPITDISAQRTNPTGDSSYARVDSGFPMVAETMRWFIRTYLPEGTDPSAPDLSPLLHPLPANLPPAMVITVDNDPLADEGAEYAAALAKAGTDVEYKHLVGYHHGLFTSAGVIDRGEAELAEIAKFISAHV